MHHTDLDCLCVCARARERVYRCTQVWKLKVNTSSAIPPHFVRNKVLTLELTAAARLATSTLQGSSCLSRCSSPEPDSTHRPLTWIYVDVGDLGWGSFLCSRRFAEGAVSPPGISFLEDLVFFFLNF